MLKIKSKSKENQDKNLQILEMLLNIQIKEIELSNLSNEEKIMQLEIAKFIKDFLLFEIEQKKFSKCGWKYMHKLVLEKYPPINKYYNNS